jgi:hypothetical protein
MVKIGLVVIRSPGCPGRERSFPSVKPNSTPITTATRRGKPASHCGGRRSGFSTVNDVIDSKVTWAVDWRIEDGAAGSILEMFSALKSECERVTAAREQNPRVKGSSTCVLPVSKPRSTDLE